MRRPTRTLTLEHSHPSPLLRPDRDEGIAGCGSIDACATRAARVRCRFALTLLAPHRAVAVRVAVRWGRELVALPVAARGHGRVTREAVAVGAGRLVAFDSRFDRPLDRMEGVERAERTLVRQVLGQQACAVQAREWVSKDHLTLTID